MKVQLDGEELTRELNTMPQWAGSCWYYLRFMDPKNDRRFVGEDAEKYWGQVDLYVGGVEHAVLHLLYARFWHKVLFDVGLVSTNEPFRKLFNQGLVLSYSYKDALGKYHGAQDVEQVDGQWVLRNGNHEPLLVQIEKMSKSKLNVTTTDEVVENYGADSLRLYEMFMGPLEATKPWQTNGISGVRRFLNRSWRLIMKEDEEGRDSFDSARVVADAPDEKLSVILHKTIKGVGEDIEGMRFNTAIAKLMELVNELTPMDKIPQAVLEPFTLMLAPFAPHMAEEMWALLGHKASLAYEPWPAYDARLAASVDQFEYPVQVNGKLRFKVPAAPGLEAAPLLAAVKADGDVSAFLAGKTIIKEVAVPGRLVNFVVKG